MTLNPKITKNIGNILIIIGGITFIVAKVIKETFPPFDLTSNEPWKGQLADNFEMYGLTLALATMIVAGSRAIRRNGFSFKRILVPLIGVGGCLLLAVECYSIHKVLASSDFSEQDKKSLRILESKLTDTDMPLEKKSKWSKLYAQMKFNHEGIKTNYIDPTGKRVDFEPTTKDIEDRNVQIKLKQISQWGKEYPYKAAISWMAVGIVSLLFGLFTPIKRDKYSIIQPERST